MGKKTHEAAVDLFSKNKIKHDNHQCSWKEIVRNQQLSQKNKVHVYQNTTEVQT